MPIGILVIEFAEYNVRGLPLSIIALNISKDVCWALDISDIWNIFENNEYIYFGGYISMKYLAILVLLGVGLCPLHLLLS